MKARLRRNRGEVILTVAALLTIISTTASLVQTLYKQHEVTKRAEIRAAQPCPKVKP